MEELLRTEIFDKLNEGVYILNSKGDYIYCNTAFLKLVGATRKDILSMNAFRLIPQKQVAVSVAVRAFEEKKRMSIVNNVVTPAGFHYRQLATATPIFDGNGGIRYMLVEMMRLDRFMETYQQALMCEDENGILEIDPANDDKTGNVIADSECMKQLLKEAAQIATMDSTVLLTGETGTGKEVLAHYIHANSARKTRAMVEINCAVLPENLLEAELFGYEKGSFTGALNTGKPGLIESANGGTLFLDEINSMPVALQGKLLRVLETHKSKRLGAVKEQDIDFRLLAATNQDLKRCMMEGTFRPDLYYRLNVVPLHIPPLRERREDIGPLVEFFADRFCKKYDRVKVFTPSAISQFYMYDWPGNVRELKNVVERLVVTSSMDTIEIRTIPQAMFGEAAGKERTDPSRKETSGPESLLYGETEEASLKEQLEGYEKKLIAHALKKYGSTYKAAAALKTDQSTVARKKKKYNL